MIHGIGIDMVDIERIEKSLGRFGDNFASRVLSHSEFEEFQKNKHQAAFVSKRFAVKEAFFKAIGFGLRNGLSFKQIEVLHDERGKPVLECYDKAREFMQTYSITHAHISITDEAKYAAAVVVLEK